jgi:hypothetical protein
LGNGFKIIELSIALDHDRAAVNVPELIKTTDPFRKSGYTSLVLQLIIRDFMMTYRIPEGAKVKLVDAFDLAGNRKVLDAGKLPY